MNGELDLIDSYRCIDDLDYLYDKWRTIECNRKLKRAGIIGGIVIGITSLITGLSLGLKRTGHNMTHDATVKWEKLTPAQRKKVVIPWTKIEKAGGKSIISLGENIYLVIIGLGIYLLVEDD